MSKVSIVPPIYRSTLSYLILSYLIEINYQWIHLRTSSILNIHILSLYSAFLYAYLSFFLIFLMFLHICPSGHLSIYLSIYVSIYLPIYLSIYLQYVITCLLVYRSTNPTLNVNVTVGTCTSICPSIYLRIISAWGRLSVCFCVCLSLIR